MKVGVIILLYYAAHMVEQGSARLLRLVDMRFCHPQSTTKALLEVFDQSDTSRSVQPQTMARGFKVWMHEEEGMQHYP